MSSPRLSARATAETPALASAPVGGPRLESLEPADYGYGLPVAYLVWSAVVLGLCPGSRWFAEVKRRRREAWLSYS